MDIKIKKVLLAILITSCSLKVSAIEPVSNTALIQCAYVANLTNRLDEQITFEYAFDLRVQADKPKLSITERRYVAGFEAGAVSVWIGLETKNLSKAEAESYYEYAYLNLCKANALPYANSIITAEAKREIDELTNSIK
jgi:hypothetical protein